jgi:hypothetical protein
MEKTNENFALFWSLYPRKTAKEFAGKSFAKLNDTDQDAAITGVKKWVEMGAFEEPSDRGDFRPHPATWINQRRWEDEIEPAKPKTNGRPLNWDEVKALPRADQLKYAERLKANDPMYSRITGRANI